MTVEDKVGKAREFAIIMHGDQRYGEKFPYSYHLDMVYDIAVQFALDTEIQIGCYLHDVLEDTDATFEQIRSRFGWYLAFLVFAVTDEPGLGRKERKRLTYQKMTYLQEERAELIKLCDRIANVKACILNKNDDLLAMYQRENEEFLNCFRPFNDRNYPLIEYLNHLLISK